MPERLCIELFGALKVRCGEREVTRFRTQKAAALLAYLALFQERAHSRERLAELFWPEAEPGAGRNSLKQEFAGLRRTLSPLLEEGADLFPGDRHSIWLNTDLFTTDVAAFAARMHEVEMQTEASLRAELLTRAVQLYSGPLLPDVYDDWALEERERLAHLYLAALRQLSIVLESSGEHERAIETARLAVSADPHREEVRADLMRLYLAQGDPVSALKQYQQYEEVLKRELDLSPSENLQKLARSCRDAARTQKTEVQVSTPTSSSPPLMSSPTVAEAPPVDNDAPIPTSPANPNRWGKGYRLGLALGMLLLCMAIVLILRPRDRMPVKASLSTPLDPHIKKKIATVRTTSSSHGATVLRHRKRNVLTRRSGTRHSIRIARTPATFSQSDSSMRQPGLTLPKTGNRPASAPKSKASHNTIKTKEPRYTITDIGTLHGDTESYALALNEAGQVVGFSQSGSLPHAFLYDASGIRPLAPNASHSGVGSIANDGQVAGGNEDEAVVWDTAGNKRVLSTGTSTGRSNVAGINDAEQVIGTVSTGSGARACLWEENLPPRLLGPLPDLGDAPSAPNAINAHGTVVGAVEKGIVRRGFVWDSAHGMQSLSVLPGGGSHGDAGAINDAGEIAGDSDAADGKIHPVYYDRDHNIHLLDTPNGLGGVACGINNQGQLVGIYDVGGGLEHACLWDQKHRPLDLTTLLPKDSGWVLLEARGINDKGQVVGNGVHAGKIHAFLMTLCQPNNP